MQYFYKDGTAFVTDLVWQKQTEKDKISLKTYRNDCKFDFYCKTAKSGISYGFARLTEKEKVDKGKCKELKKAISLAVFILESVDIDEDADLFICFKFAEDLYGYILLRNGSVFSEGGEFIGSLKEVEGRVGDLARKYKVRIAYIADDVPLYNNEPFAKKAGIEVITLRSSTDKKTKKFTPASDYYFWQRRRKRKEIVARMRPVAVFTNKHKFIFAGAFLLLLAILLLIVKSMYFSNGNVEQMTRKVIPIKRNSSFPAAPFINACLAKFDKFNVNVSNWQTATYKCSLKNINVTYVSNNGKREDLINLTAESGITFTQQGASLVVPIKIAESPETMTNIPLSVQIDSLTDLSNKLGLKLNLNQNKYDIQSNYSPLFLFKNGVINSLNITEITMSNNLTGKVNLYPVWDIKGEINDSK